MTTLRQTLGKEGEAIAAQYLQGLGYLLHEQNVRLHPDEIDLVMFDPADRSLVFVEVKTRRAKSEYSPLLNITASKVRALRRAARSWVEQRGYEGSYRIDVITVVAGTVVDHLKELPWD